MAPIIGILASLVGPAIEVGICVARPIKRQFMYLCCFNDNVRSLRDEAQNLKDKKDGLQMRVDADRRNAKVVLPEVQTWLEGADQKMEIVDGIEIDIPSVEKGCLNLLKRYSVSRNAKKTADSVREFKNSFPPEPISQDAPPESVESVRNYGQMLAFESRKKIEEDIMKALKDRNVNTIGICGMAGVGKTTMAKRIMNRVRVIELFGDVVFVPIGQQMDKNRIQREIGASLGLELKEEFVSAQAHKLRKRLLDNKKDSLIVLDDLWESLNIDELGIPCGSLGNVKCKVLLTSRNRDILNELEPRNIFGMPILTEIEAWSLFKEKAGSCVDVQELHSIAKDVATECKCLPLAIVTVGVTLKDKMTLQVWKDALAQLRSSNPLDLPKVLEEVYIPIKLSYDKLVTPREKSLFLLCSMFKEDSNIDLEVLTWYGMALHLFIGTRSLEEARNRTINLVEVLKGRFLLLDGVEDGDVKMHDVVRDTARYIALSEGFMINLDEMSMDRPMKENHSKDSLWTSMILSNQMDEQFPMGLQFSKLRLLLMQNREGLSFTEPLNIPDSFFDGMEDICMLSLEDILITSLPPSTQVLKNLQTLRLSNCGISESIVVVSELLLLEIFSCRNCDNIKVLPIEFARLNHLKVFEIIECANLKTIARGVISSFVLLEELRLRCSFDGWEGNGNGRTTNANVVLEELQSLLKLSCLEIEIKNYHLVSEEISLPSKIVNCCISINRHIYNHRFPKSLCMHIPMEVNIGNWIVELLRSSENLNLSGDGLCNINFLELKSVRSLTISDCETKSKLVKSIGDSSGFGILPKLESLILVGLGNLDEIFDGTLFREEPFNISFQNLTRILINDCDELRYLFPVSVVRSLLQLETLELQNCSAMENVIICDYNETEHGKTSHLSFSKLKSIGISYMTSLTSMCKGVQSIEFPKITQVIINLAPKFVGFLTNPKASSQQLFDDKVVIGNSLRTLFLNDLDASISCVWSYQISNVTIFDNLYELMICSLDGIKKLMTPSIAQNLIRLRKLCVARCKELLHVIGDDDLEQQTLTRLTLFPQLEMLYLYGNPKLRFFCDWKHVNVEFPLLNDIIIDECQEMQALSQEDCYCPNLEVLWLNYEPVKAPFDSQELREIGRN